VYPKKLPKNATIGIVAPSSPIKEEKVLKGKQALEQLGFKVVLGESCFKRYAGYLSGTDDIRANDINKMFSDKSIDGIICLKGGYGSPRIVDLVDYENIKKNPKFFSGFSDVTALLNAIYLKCDLVTYHGLMLTVDFIKQNDISIKSFFDCAIDQKKNYIIQSKEAVVINEGIVEGVLVGGNLSLMCAMSGSEFMFDPTNKILLIEEIHEEVYRVDRMLQNLRLSGILNKVKGIVVGGITAPKEQLDKEYSYYQLFTEFLQPLGIPVIYNFPIGHVTPRYTVPIGAKVELNTYSKSLTII
jgi:muramoyltetrapeptide carboxypeptidase